MWQRCTLATRTARFHAPVRHMPVSYLKAVLDDPAASVMAQHERTGDVVALAGFGRFQSALTPAARIRGSLRHICRPGSRMACWLAAARAGGIQAHRRMLASRAPVSDSIRRAVSWLAGKAVVATIRAEPP
jgi:hypothetical protein